MEDKVFLLHCSVSASIRQSTQINFIDLQLPDAVVDTLQKQQSIPIRSTLSGKLKQYLTQIRGEQKSLYEECCIHNGDIHFLHESYFDQAMARIERIRSMAVQYNEQLQEEWFEEYSKWSVAVDGFIEPLFANDPEGLKIAKEAYLSIFPTRQEFQNPIKVFVVGPNPVSLEVSENSEEHSISSRMQEAALFNTTEVLEAAKEGASDKALSKAAELLDDLDVRSSSKISERQTGGAKRRGSWEVVAIELERISRYCPGFDRLADLARELIEVGLRLQTGTSKIKDSAYKEYLEIKKTIRNELTYIVNSRNSTTGLETLKKSLALSSTYKDLISQIKEAESQDDLDRLQAELSAEVDIYKQRSRHLQSIYEKKRELIIAHSASVELCAEELTKIQTPDF